MTLTVATWNVNSIKMRTGHVQRFIAAQNPDVLMLQEIKCTTDKFPHDEFRDTHPHQLVIGQPAYNGVAILSKIPFDTINTALPGLANEEQARYIEITLQGDKPYRLINIYAPNGNPVSADSEKYPYKLRWLDALYRHAHDLLHSRIPFLIAGDFNIIPARIDCLNENEWIGDALYREDTWERWRKLLYLGLTDAFRALYPKKEKAFTFWDYQGGGWPRNNGIRIDHVLLSPLLTDRLQDCVIDKTPRGEEKPSDHTPVIVTLD
ncbi:MAG TPA: exodeoxyribonuclease III [Alphaproteobacteria bacterium]